MKNFVKLIQQVHEERFSAVMNRIGARKIPVAFLSIAPINQAVEITKNLRAQGLNITRLFVIDNNPPPVNLDFDVIHVKDAAQIFPQPEYICAVENIGARVAIKNFPASKVLSLDRGNREDIYQTFMTHLDDLREVYESLIDEESKKTFRGYWLGCISNRLDKIVYSKSWHYLIDGFIPADNAIVIDGGSCDGGTATIFSDMGYKVYGFELDDLNYAVACKRAEEKNFVIENLGLGSYPHKMHYLRDQNNPGACRVDVNGSETAQITTLDIYVREKNLPRVDLIKLDVEGAELDVLKGAVTTIARFKPILAISVYHKLDDFWTLMNFIKSIRPDYEFAMRQFADTVEDVPSVFTNEKRDTLVNLGLKPHFKTYGECTLFAR